MWLNIGIGFASFWVGFISACFFGGVGRQNLEADLATKEYEIKMLKDELKKDEV